MKKVAKRPIRPGRPRKSLGDRSIKIAGQLLPLDIAIEKFLIANPHISFAKLSAIALSDLFAKVRPDLKSIGQGLRAYYQLDLSCLVEPKNEENDDAK